jgi:Tol biopolymer transport system component
MFITLCRYRWMSAAVALLSLVVAAGHPLPAEQRNTARATPTGPADSPARPALVARLENVRQITPAADFNSPLWSPSREGELAFTSPRGTFLYSEATGVRKLLTSRVAGFKPVWSSDGRSIVFRSRQDERTFTIEQIDVHTGDVHIVDRSSDLGLPQEVGAGVIEYRRGSFHRKVSMSGADSAASGKPYADQDNDDILIAIQGEVRKINRDAGRYFLPQISPDGSKVLYQEISRGIYVTDLATGGTVSLGLGDDPMWLPDGSRLVFELTADDGHSILASDLYLADLQGHRARLSRSAHLIEMHPAVSADGRRLAFDSKGAIFVADLVVEK